MEVPFVAPITKIEIIDEVRFACTVNGERRVWFHHDTASIPLDHVAVVLREQYLIQFFDHGKGTALVSYAPPALWRSCEQLRRSNEEARARLNRRQP